MICKKIDLTCTINRIESFKHLLQKDENVKFIKLVTKAHVTLKHLNVLSIISQTRTVIIYL